MTAGRREDRGRWLQDDVDARRRGLRQALDESRDPPSRVRQQRVWQRIEHVQLARPRRPRLVWTLPLLAASLAVAGWLLVVRNHTPATPVAVMSKPAPAPAVVSLIDTLVVTGVDETIVRKLPGDVTADVLPASQLALSHEGRAEVRAGRVRFSVPRQAKGKRYTVAVAGHEVVVVGTRFVVEATPERLGVTVEQGIVEIWHGRRLARLGPGESWTRGAHGHAAHTVASAPRTRPPALSRPQPDEADALAAARAALAAADPQRALSIYQSLAAGRGPGAENALYELGRLYRHELGDADRAIRVWDRSRKRFPDGLLRPEVDLSLVETLAEAGHDERAFLEAKRFLARHPHSERRAEIARVAGDLARSQGDCQQAIGFYEQVLRTQPRGRDADDAAFHRAACLSMLGSADASTAWASYLREHPRGRHREAAAKALQAGRRKP